MTDWTDATLWIYGFGFFLIGCLIPITIILFATRVIARMTKKTVRSIRK